MAARSARGRGAKTARAAPAAAPPPPRKRARAAPQEVADEPQEEAPAPAPADDAAPPVADWRPTSRPAARDFVSARVTGRKRDAVLMRAWADLLRAPPDEVAAAAAALDAGVQPRANDKAARARSLEARFPEWREWMRRGYSVLLYGYGSKRALLDKFAASASPGGVLCVDAGAAGATARGATLAAAKALGLAPRGRSAGAALDALGAAPAGRCLTVVVHGVDRFAKAGDHDALSRLAAAPPIRLIASSDHAAAPLLWDKEVAGRFNWRWADATSFAPYGRDLGRLPGLSAGDRDEATAESAAAVLAALVPNARAVFGLLATAQLARGDGDGVPLDALQRAARERFLASSEAVLGGYLAEFRDHGLLTTKRGGGGGDALSIPLPKDALAALVDALAADEGEDNGGGVEGVF